MTRRTVVVAFDVDDAPNGPEHAVNAADIVDGIKARLDEFYPSDDLQPFVPADVRAVVLDPLEFSAWTAATIVGLDGAEDASGFTVETLDAAWRAASALSGSPVSPEDVAEPTEFRITIATDNAAFMPDVVPEVSKMLQELATRLLMEHERFTPGVTGTQHDHNGNTVLSWTWDRTR